TRAGFIAFVVANIIFWIILFLQKTFNLKVFLRNFIIVNALFILCNFFFGIPVAQLSRFTIPELKNHFAAKQQAPAAPVVAAPTAAPTQPADAQQPAKLTTSQIAVITDSGDIRKFVWKGAIDAWKSSPLFGTGVETFAFAYYKFRPAGHN